MDSWEDYEEEDAVAIAPGAYEEDEADQAIRDSWDADEDTDGKQEDKTENAAASKKKRSLQQAIEDRKRAEEQRKREIAEKKTQIAEEADEDPMARKQRLAQLERDADMENTIGLFAGVAVAPATATEAIGSSTSSLDQMSVKTKSDLEAFSDLLTKKVSTWKLRSSLLVPFYEKLFRDLSDGLDYADIRKLSTVLSALANEKQRIEKEKKSGKKGSTKKAQVKVVADDMMDQGTNDDYADYDDFM